MRLFEEKYLKVLHDTFEANKDMEFQQLLLIKCISSKYSGKYVGCVHCRNASEEEVCVNINNSTSKTMLYYPMRREVEFIGEIPNLHFSYTGGCLYSEGRVFGFMRNSNKLLDIDIDSKTVKEVDYGLDISQLNNKTVLGHHYGGVLKGSLIVIPPRLADDVLFIDLKKQELRHVKHSIFHENNYNGAVLHPNGKVYFTPMHGSAVAEFNSETLAVRLIGKKIPNSLFGGAVYADGCIYSFSQNKGLYRIDPARESVEMILKETEQGTPVYGSYGTITHYNGKIYNVPGNSNYVYEYDPVKQRCKVVAIFDDGRFNKAKWAGGALLESGNIYLTPAFGRFVCEMQFSRKAIVSDEMRRLIYSEYIKPL